MCGRTWRLTCHCPRWVCEGNGYQATYSWMRTIAARLPRRLSRISASVASLEGHHPALRLASVWRSAIVRFRGFSAVDLLAVERVLPKRAIATPEMLAAAVKSADRGGRTTATPAANEPSAAAPAASVNAVVRPSSFRQYYLRQQRIPQPSIHVRGQIAIARLNRMGYTRHRKSRTVVPFGHHASTQIRVLV